MSNYCITLYTPKYFYDNLEQDILSKNIIFNYNKLLIIIKCFIDYKYIETIEATTNELYFACSYRYVWIGAVIRGILFKYSYFD
jgi:hypothetical protein